MKTLTVDELGVPPPPGIVNLHNDLLYALRKAYPAFAQSWRIVMNLDQGVVDIYNNVVSQEFGFRVKMTEAQGPAGKTITINGGGELLERYRISREKNTDAVEAIDNLRFTRTGKVIHDE